MYEKYSFDLQTDNNLDQEKTYFEYYTIKKGDTMYEIAKRYNINPDLLASLNGINLNDYIYPEQIILIPKANYSYYITKSGDTIDGVSRVFGITKEELMEANNVIYLLDGQLLVNKSR